MNILDIKIQCPKCGQVFVTPITRCVENHAPGIEFKCEECGVKLKPLTEWKLKQRSIGLNKPFEFSSVVRGVLVGIFAIVMPVILWLHTGNAAFALGSIAASVVIVAYYCITYMRNLSAEPVEAEMEQNGT